MMNIEADLVKVKPKKVYLYRVAAEFMFDLCVLDPVADGFEILCGRWATESTEDTEMETEKPAFTNLTIGTRT